MIINKIVVVLQRWGQAKFVRAAVSHCSLYCKRGTFVGDKFVEQELHMRNNCCSEMFSWNFLVFKSYNRQRDFICSHVHQGERNAKGGGKTIQICCEVGKAARVCKKFFIATLGIGI
jgi:hypothetical protein